MNELEKALFRGVFDYARIAAENLLSVPENDMRARSVASRAAEAALKEYREQRDAKDPCSICGSTNAVHNGEAHDAVEHE